MRMERGFGERFDGFVRKFIDGLAHSDDNEAVELVALCVASKRELDVV